MSKKTTKAKVIDLGSNGGAITTQEVPAGSLAVLPTIRHESVKVMDAGEFAKLAGNGEVSFGMQILKLRVGEAAGPFTLVKILPQQDCTPAGAKKKFDPVDVYCAADTRGLEIRMPISASFIMKAKDMKLTIGDEFHLMRLEDYKSKTYEKDGQSYALAISTRAAGGKK